MNCTDCGVELKRADDVLPTCTGCRSAALTVALDAPSRIVSQRTEAARSTSSSHFDAERGASASPESTVSTEHSRGSGPQDGRPVTAQARDRLAATGAPPST